MRGAVILFILGLFPVFADAAPLRVQTGEHASFTRVVIGIPPDIEWRLGRADQGYTLRLPTDDGFVLAQFFDLIPRDRITAVDQDPNRGELRLRVECLCHARATVYRSQYLVIDIHDGPAPAASPFELALPDEQSFVVGENLANQQTVSYQFTPDPVLPVITPRIPVTGSATNGEEAAKTERSATDPNAPSTQVQDTDDALEMIAQTLSSSLGRAMTAGLLQEEAPFGRAETEGANQADPRIALKESPFPGLNARTSVDPGAVSDAALPQTQVGKTCLPDSSFDIASWGNESPPYLQLRQTRNALTNPADEFQDGALLVLARLYVFLGFGREALQTLDLEDVLSRDRVLLRAVAQLIEDEPVSQDLFAGQVSCPSRVALWALLAQPTGPTDAKVDRTAVITAYQALPTYVQEQIAPRLTEALLAIGAQDAALQIIGRQPRSENADVALQLAGAALSDALGEETQAIETITDVARNDPRTTPEALTRFFIEGVANEVSFSDEDFLLADALRFENTRTPAAAGLADAQYNAYLSVDRFEDARGSLQRRMTTLSPQDVTTMRSALFRQATERMPDAAFLEFVWQEDLGEVDADTQNIVAARLLTLGFPERALVVLSGVADDAALDAQDVLRRQATRDAAVQQTTPENPQQVGDVQRSNDDEVSADLTVSDGSSLQTSRALVESAAQSRQTIRALLQGVPAPEGL